METIPNSAMISPIPPVNVLTIMQDQAEAWHKVLECVKSLDGRRFLDFRDGAAGIDGPLVDRLIAFLHDMERELMERRAEALNVETLFKEAPWRAGPAYAPLTFAEAKDLTAMVWGAPCDDDVIERVVKPCIEQYDRLRATGERPLDPAAGQVPHPDEELDPYGAFVSGVQALVSNVQALASNHNAIQPRRKVVDLSDVELLLMVARAAGITSATISAEGDAVMFINGTHLNRWDESWFAAKCHQDEANAGLRCDNAGPHGYIARYNSGQGFLGATPGQAMMRAFVVRKFGEEVVL